MLRLVKTASKTVLLAAEPKPLETSSYPCRGVLVMAPADANGAATNSKPAWIGVSSSDGGNKIMLGVANFEGIYIPINDASLIYVDIGADNETVNYAIFQA